MDHGSVLSPPDLAVGWGPVSDQAVLDQLRGLREGDIAELDGSLVEVRLEDGGSGPVR